MIGKQGIRCLRLIAACGIKPVPLTRSWSRMPFRPIGALSSSEAIQDTLSVHGRAFSMETASPSAIKKRIESCGINDAGKEKIIEEEAKKKNFEALRQLGEDLIENKDTKELGILCFVQAADHGDCKSQFAVGNMYLQRYWQEKMKPDSDMKAQNNLMEKCKQWYEMGSKQGDINSKVGLAKILLEDPTRANVERALSIYEEADKAHNVDATYNLGFIYYEGLYSIPKERKKGFTYLARAAEQGDISACYFLGYAYHKGLHENDNPNAPVPTVSEEGKGGEELCKKDVGKCLAFLEKAVVGGHSKAMIYMHQMYHNGEGVDKNVQKANDYLIKAMRCGDPEALFIRGNQLYSGDEGVEMDKAKALKLFLDAGERGNADAMCSAGAMVYNGEGQEKDLKKAFELYTNAASLGSLPAIKNIASMYLMGEGVEKDVETAKNLMHFIEEEEKKKGGNIE